MALEASQTKADLLEGSPILSRSGVSHRLTGRCSSFCVIHVLGSLDASQKTILWQVPCLGHLDSAPNFNMPKRASIRVGDFRRCQSAF